jgi:3-oxoacyl-[acyl-carrier protein] reductase
MFGATENMFELTGQTAIVTGAGTGIGEVIAQRLTAAGARVAIADIDGDAAKAAAERIGGGAFPLILDVTKPEQVEAAVAKVLRIAGSLEILVNNAGIAGRAAPIWEQTDADWHRVMDLNINAPFYLCRAVLPHMRTKGYGRIVNIASIAGKEGNPNMVAYSASKAAVIGSRGRRHLHQCGGAGGDPHQNSGTANARAGRLHGAAHSHAAHRPAGRGRRSGPLSL